MRVGNEKLVDPIVFFGGGGLFAATAAFLGAVFRQRLALDVTAVRQRNHHVGGRDQVFGGQILRIVFNEAAACTQFGLAKFLAQFAQFGANDGGHALGLGQDVEQVFNFRHDFFVLDHNLVLLESCQALQTHLQNLLRLGFA